MLVMSCGVCTEDDDACRICCNISGSCKPLPNVPMEFLSNGVPCGINGICTDVSEDCV